MMPRTLGKAISYALLAVWCAAGQCGCLATKPYKKPEVQTDGLYGAQQVQLDQKTLAEMPWQEVFSDPKLRALIDEALRNNLDLKQAIAQIRVAEADFYEARMALYPSLDAHAEFGYTNPSDNNVNFGSRLSGITIPATTSYELSGAASWEADIWGKLTSLKRAQLAALLETEAARRAVQTQLIADVATGYYTLLALDAQLAITRRTVRTFEQEVKTLRALKKGAVVNELSVQQAIASRYATESTIPDLEQQILEQQNALSRLLGRPPGPIERSSLSDQQPIGNLALGVPAQLLQNRPDVIEAEYAFRQAFALTNNARARFYPSLTLTAQGGLRSLKATDFFDPGSLFYNLIAGLTQPIFEKGQNIAQLKRTKAQQKQAMLQLQSTLLQAGVEVSNALSLYQNSREKLGLRDKQIVALKHAVDYSSKLLEYGESNYLDVLTARRGLLQAQLDRVTDKLQRLTAGVQLYHALGGGWKKPHKAHEQQ